MESPAALSPLIEIVNKTSTLNEKQEATEALWKLSLKGIESPRG
jgi:hypothetical protein